MMKRRTRRHVCESLEPRALLSTTTGEPPAIFGAADPFSADNDPVAVAAAAVTYPGGVTITDTEIITMADVIPRFAAEPTITAIRSGAWMDPGTWSEGRVPTANDRVLIPQEASISYFSQIDSPLEAIEVWGSLNFSVTSSTRLVVGTLTIMPTGSLQIGTVAQPIRPYVTAEIVIADRALNLQIDPRQFGTGLIALGRVSIHGALLSQTWTQLAAEPRVGDTSLLLSNADAKWRAGDTLVIPDTRQVPTSQSQQFVAGTLPPHWEEVTIDHVAGNQVFLTQPLQFDHLGARDTDGELELLPHVAILDRNVVVRSENPEGTRGHVLFAVRADIDIRYARFQDLGRTDAFRDLDDTTFDAEGNVTHIGTNQIARYAMHFHHLIGPENPTNTGYQFQFVGNTVDGARKWGIAVHGTSYGQVSKNVVYDAQGAGIVTEDGSEIENVFSDNITVRIVGTHLDGKSGTQEGDYGRGGTGFWFRRGGNTVIGNVAADSTYAGFVFDGYYNTDTVRLPNFRGAMKHMPGQGHTVELNPPTHFTNNEAYGLTTYGLWAAYISGHNLRYNQPQTTLTNFRVWNVSNAGIRMYHTSNVTILNATIYGDTAAQDRNDTGATGFYLVTYENRDLIIVNARIEGMRYGIIAPRSDSSQAGRDRPTIIQNSRLKNYINILVAPAWDFGPGDGTALVVRNVKFDLLTQLPPGPDDPSTIDPPANIQMRYATESVDLTKRVVVKVYDYNQVPGDNFQVYFREQSGNYIVPQTDPALLNGSNAGTIGAPEAGLTNAMSRNKYGVSIGGQVVYYPASRPEINGLVGPIVDSTAIMPCVAIVTPWDEATVGSETPVNLRYNVNGQLADYTYVFFSVDGGYRFTADGNGWISGLAPGWHTLVAWIGNVPGIEVPGTVGDTVTFFVQSASSSPSGETVEPAAAWPDNGQTVNASAYGAITPGLALRISGEPDARPATAVDTIVERPDLALLPLTPDTPRLQAPGAMWQTDVSGGAVDEAALDLSPGDRWLTELAEDVAAIGPCHDKW